METSKIETIEKCAADSAAGKISFGDVVGRLMSVGVERYHADYTRGETTFYLPDGESLVVKSPLPHEPIASVFSIEAVQQAVRQAQSGTIRYPAFVQQTCAAGCVGYFVQITGRRVIYFGRDGDQHVEQFPSANT